MMLTLKRAVSLTSERPARGCASGVSIEYCVPGNHERAALDLASAIRERFGLQPQLRPSRGGVFEVTVDGRLVFSKRASRRFPDRDEIFYHIQNRKR